MPHPRKLQPMQQQPHLGSRSGPHLDPLPGRGEMSPSSRSIPAWQRSMAAAAEKA